MVSKTLQICCYRISQEQITSAVTFEAVTLGELLSLATPEDATMEWENFDFYLDHWKMHLRQLFTLRC